MKVWWITDVRRLAREKQAVEELVGEGWFNLTKWTVHDLKLSAEGEVLAQENRYPVRLVYADQFPQVPAWVEPLNADAKWSHHQYGRGGTLCLELRPDNWVPSATGADVLRSAYHLLRTENPLGASHEVVESAHQIGTIQTYLWHKEPVLIGVECLLRLFDDTAEGLRALRWTYDDRVWPIYLFDAEDQAAGKAPPGPEPYARRTELRVMIVRCTIPQPPPETRGELLSALGVSEVVDDADPLLVVAYDGDRVRPFHCPEGGSAYSRKLVVVNDAVGVRSGRAVTVATQRVAIIGVGSVGSKMAESLVRSGVRRLLLVDGDIFLPGNIERHTFGLAGRRF